MGMIYSIWESGIRRDTCHSYSTAKRHPMIPPNPLKSGSDRALDVLVVASAFVEKRSAKHDADVQRLDQR